MAGDERRLYRVEQSRRAIAATDSQDGLDLRRLKCLDQLAAALPVVAREKPLGAMDVRCHPYIELGLQQNDSARQGIRVKGTRWRHYGDRCARSNGWHGPQRRHGAVT